jgi:hypothetical protein
VQECGASREGSRLNMPVAGVLAHERGEFDRQ